jgi:hypothetical protein
LLKFSLRFTGYTELDLNYMGLRMSSTAEMLAQIGGSERAAPCDNNPAVSTDKQMSLSGPTCRKQFDSRLGEDLEQLLADETNLAKVF